MKGTWERLETWLGVHAPVILDSLGRGATAAELQELEALIGAPLPDDVRASYAIHNGQTPDPGGSPGFLYGWSWFSLDRIAGEWRCWKELLDRGDFDGCFSEPDGPIRPWWWNPRWIPITGNDFSDHHCVDLDPAPGGTSGQIISLWHDDPYRGVEAASMHEWLAAFADALEREKYLYSEDHAGLVTVREFEEDREALEELRRRGKL